MSPCGSCGDGVVVCDGDNGLACDGGEQSCHVCEVDARRCDGDLVERCEDGTGWVAGLSCDFGCADGLCQTAVCSPGAAECTEAGNVQACPDGRGWTTEVCPAGCADGACLVSCDDGDLRCIGATAERCDVGVWVTVEDCPESCEEGTCVAATCTPEDGRCDGDLAERCGIDGHWRATTCANGCQDGFCVGDAEELCDGVDNDGNGLIDDHGECWTAVYRFSTPEHRVCWNFTSTQPAACADYNYEIEAWIMPRHWVPGTMRLIQCSYDDLDHILLEAGTADQASLDVRHRSLRLAAVGARLRALCAG